MNSPLISVIIPVYNVEEYIERCVFSVLNQSYQQLEVILIDDGSTDQSGIICDKLATLDNRIRVIHQPNQGLGPARNSGLNVIHGDYVAFVDSDDWIAPNTYDYLYNSINKNHCEIATCGRRIVSCQGSTKTIYCLDNEIVLDSKEAIRQYLLQQKMNMSACDKLFNAKLFDGIRFPEGFVSEDIVPIYETIKKSNGVCLTGLPLYYYYSRNGSLSRSSFSSRLMGRVLYSERVHNDVISSFPELKYEADYFIYDAIIGVYRNIRWSNYNGKEKAELFEYLKIHFMDILNNQFIHRKQKIYLFFIIAKIDRIMDTVFRWVRRKWSV